MNARSIVLVIITLLAASAGAAGMSEPMSTGDPRIETELHENRELTVHQQGSRVEISIEGNVGFILGRLTEEVVIYINHGTSLDIDVASADIELDDVERVEFVLNAGSGDVEVTRSTGLFRVTTSSGDQSYSNVSGTLVLEAGSGDIDLDEVEGVTEITTNSGDVSGDDVVLTGNLTIQTGSGDVDVELDHAMAELRFALEAGSGDQSYTTDD
jgi:DUF4097 and DUF4098 domain-containing protein YvlB